MSVWTPVSHSAHALKQQVNMRSDGRLQGPSHDCSYHKGIRRILVRGVNDPLPPEAKKIVKNDYEMVHSEVNLHNAVLYTCLP